MDKYSPIIRLGEIAGKAGAKGALDAEDSLIRVFKVD